MVETLIFCNMMLKVQLYEILKVYKPKHKSSIVDKIMAADSCKVVQLATSPRSQPYRINMGGHEAVGLGQLT
jgi:hypothetical protein